MACFSLDAAEGNVCRKFCITDADCPSDRKCDQNVNFQGGETAQFCGEITIGCNAFDQSTCPEGQGCYLSNNATKCMPAGTLAKGEPCKAAGSNSCTPGLQCLIECTEICAIIDVGPDEPKCADTCTGGINAVNNENGIGICLGAEPPKECDLFKQEGCAAGQGCYPTTQGWQCLNAGASKEGAACQFTNDCVPGTLCVNSQCSLACSLKDDAEAETKCENRCGASNGWSPQEWGVGFCTDAEPEIPCNFWKQDCEDAGKDCYVVNNGAACLDKGNEGATGSPCQYLQDCAAGLMCYQSECTEVCSINEFAEGATVICIDDCPGGDFEPISIENGIGRCK